MFDDFIAHNFTDTHASSDAALLDGCYLKPDGWITTPNGKLLFRLPHGNRVCFQWSTPSQLIIGGEPTEVDFSQFVYGDHWTECRTLLS
jgi:hypothetical protein